MHLVVLYRRDFVFDQILPYAGVNLINSQGESSLVIAASRGLQKLVENLTCLSETISHWSSLTKQTLHECPSRMTQSKTTTIAHYQITNRSSITKHTLQEYYCRMKSSKTTTIVDSIIKSQISTLSMRNFKFHQNNVDCSSFFVKRC